MKLRLADSDLEYTTIIASPEELAVKAHSEEKDILSMIGGGQSDGRLWVCSKPFTDEATQEEESAKKKVRVIGAKMNPSQSGLGYACCKGVEQQAQSNQDSWLILKAEGLSIYGVFDGTFSKSAKEAMPRLILESKPFRYSNFRSRWHMTAMLKNVFQRTHYASAAATGMSNLDAHLSGSTCFITVHDHGNNRLYVSWTGNRGACIASSAGATLEGGLVSSELTWYYKPWVGEEKAYIKKVGGEMRDDRHDKVVNAKTCHYPNWNMTVSTGNLLGQVHRGLTAGPTVNVFNLKDGDSAGLILFVCSDVVWENISHAEALKIVASHPRSDAKVAAEKIAKIAWDNRKNREDGRVVEDIIAVVIHLTSYGLVAV